MELIELQLCSKLDDFALMLWTNFDFRQIWLWPATGASLNYVNNHRRSHCSLRVLRDGFWLHFVVQDVLRNWLLQTFEASARRLQQAGYRRETATVMSQHSSYLLNLADASVEMESKHAHYLAVSFFWEQFGSMLVNLIWFLSFSIGL